MVILKSGGISAVRDRGCGREKKEGRDGPGPLFSMHFPAPILSEKHLRKSRLGDGEQNDRHEHEPGKPIDDLPHLKAPPHHRGSVCSSLQSIRERQQPLMDTSDFWRETLRTDALHPGDAGSPFAACMPSALAFPRGVFPVSNRGGASHASARSARWYSS
jgi:hypothetical protein